MGREIQAIEELNQGLTVQSENQRRLLAELEELLGRVDLPTATRDRLLRGKLDGVEAVRGMTDAAFELSMALTGRLDEQVEVLEAVRSARDDLAGVRDGFSRRLVDYLGDAFRTMGEQRGRARQVYLSCGLGDDALSYLRHYDELLRLLAELDAKRHAEALGVSG